MYIAPAPIPELSGTPDSPQASGVLVHAQMAADLACWAAEAEALAIEFATLTRLAGDHCAEVAAVQIEDWWGPSADEYRAALPALVAASRSAEDDMSALMRSMSQTAQRLNSERMLSCGRGPSSWLDAAPFCMVSM